MSNEGGWMIAWRWRMWTFGLFFGPEVWGVALGPLSVGYAPTLDYPDDGWRHDVAMLGGDPTL